MKKLLFILLCLPLLTLAQQTYVPDDNFEQKLINLGYDNILDDSVTTASIDTITFLLLMGGSIADLTGIEDFTALTELDCNNNQLTSLDVSNNTSLIDLKCSSNQLTSLDISNNTALGYLNCEENQLIILDISNNTNLVRLFCHYNQLTGIDLSNNTALIYLRCDNNQIISLDVSGVSSLYGLACSNNQLISLDLRNGNNINMNPACADNPNLYCIDVDNETWATDNWNNIGHHIDTHHYFNNNCSITGIEEHTTNKELLKVTDILGRETKEINQLLFYIYDDGTVEKRITIE